MDRAHRIGQTRPVLVFRLATAHSVEGRLLQRANSKLMLERLVIKQVLSSYSLGQTAASMPLAGRLMCIPVFNNSKVLHQLFGFISSIGRELCVGRARPATGLVNATAEANTEDMSDTLHTAHQLFTGAVRLSAESCTLMQSWGA